MKFTVDPAAPRLEADYALLNAQQVAPILPKAQLVYETIQDNDMERWSLTQGGQFVRETGLEGGRFYVVPNDEAADYLDGMIADEVRDALVECGAFTNTPEASPR